VNTVFLTIPTVILTPLHFDKAIGTYTVVTDEDPPIYDLHRVGITEAAGPNVISGFRHIIIDVKGIVGKRFAVKAHAVDFPYHLINVARQMGLPGFAYAHK
jgi:hypothetical protein